MDINHIGAQVNVAVTSGKLRPARHGVPPCGDGLRLELPAHNTKFQCRISGDSEK
jgi:hypothetical protein